MSGTFTEQQLATVRAMTAWFLPPTPGFPDSTKADPDGSVLRLVADQLEPVLPQIVAALDAAHGRDVNAYLPTLEAERAEAFEWLRILIIGHYLTCRPVWDVLGYTGRRPVPIRPGEAEADLADGLLEPAIARGKIYRPTPR